MTSNYESKESEVAQPCPTLFDPVDCSLSGSSIDGIFQARVLEWGAIAFSYIVLVNLIHFIIRGDNTPGVWTAHFDRYKGINMVIAIQFSLTSLDEDQL